MKSSNVFIISTMYIFTVKVQLFIINTYILNNYLQSKDTYICRSFVMACRYKVTENAGVKSVFPIKSLESNCISLNFDSKS